MKKYLQGISITLFFKNKRIFEKKLYDSLFGKNFQYNVNMVRSYTERCFLTDFNYSHCN